MDPAQPPSASEGGAPLAAPAAPAIDKDRRRQRLDRELGFAAPGPAFQMDAGPQAQDAESNERGSRRSRRATRLSQAARESGLLRAWQQRPPGASATPLEAGVVLASCETLCAQLARASDAQLRDAMPAMVRELYHLQQFVTHTPHDPSSSALAPSAVLDALRSELDRAKAAREVAPRASPRTTPRRTSRMASPRSDATLSPATPAKRARTDAPPDAGLDSRLALVPLASPGPLDRASVPALAYTAPTQCPLPKTTASFSEWMSSLHMWDDDEVPLAVRQQRLARDIHIYLRLDALRRAGTVLEPAAASSLAKLKPQEAPRTKSHWDFVLEGATARAQFVRQTSRARVQGAKKIARMIVKYWDRALHGDERMQKLELRRQRALAKWTMKEVQRQWKLAVTVVRARKQEAERAERDKLGKQQLQAMIEQSTQMLETQHAELRPAETSSESDMGSDDDEGSEEEDGLDDDDDDDDGEVEDEVGEDEEEEELSAEELENDAVQAHSDMDEADDSEAVAEVLTSSHAASPASPSASTPAPSDDERLEQAMWEDDENADDDDEDDDLLAEAEMPLEELMARYGYNGTAQQERATSPAASTGTAAADAREAPPAAEEAAVSRDVSPAATSSVSHAETKADAAEAQADWASDADSDDSATSHASSSSETPGSLRALLGDTKASSDALPNVRPPFLLRGTLRPYQQKGMEWLISLYTNQMNGILADEMGLGKTIQTISLLAHLACDRGVWGPHLIVAPTSVMLNWEMEFKKFLPGFKILSYYGNQKQRKAKRVGWNTPNSFHVCITSYQLVLADQHIFRRKPWVYLVLDEAHHIKNFRSQRWQTLLGFRSERRLLLTGTPLQNNLMDLWSLLYFLMPQGLDKVATASGAFANMKDFQEWFSNPLGKAAESTQDMDAETQATIAKLHTVLRPYVLRRLKSDVEREMPQKFEHVVPCRLSKRQRFLYNDFMSRAKTRESLASGNYMSIINCLMQLRKVCNHPDLFEPRPIVSPFVTRAVAADYEIKDLLVRRRLLHQGLWEAVDLDFLGLRFVPREEQLTPLLTRRCLALDASHQVAHAVDHPGTAPLMDTTNLASFHRAMQHRRALAAFEQAQHAAYVNAWRCLPQPVLGRTLLHELRGAAKPLITPIDGGASHTLCMEQCDALRAAVLSPSERAGVMQTPIARFACATPAAMAPDVTRLLLPTDDVSSLQGAADPLHQAAVAHHLSFPDASLLQYDCGKLQKLDELMRQLSEGGHRVLIFTQMTKVLDILEKFLNYHGYRYLRLDGATKVEQRQALTERFNRDVRITAFILSTRSGGLGINLVGADTVIFYDLDWNAAIESQCMDRAHRIGQTRDVHIYRFVSEHTIEENMLRKANQKRRLDSMVIQQGEFTTEHLLKNDWRDMLDDNGLSLGGVRIGEAALAQDDTNDVEKAFRAAEDAEDAAAVRVADEELRMDHADFEGEPDKTGVPLSADDPTPTPDRAVRAGDDDDAEESVEDEDDLVGSIDDYMLRCVPTHSHQHCRGRLGLFCILDRQVETGSSLCHETYMLRRLSTQPAIPAFRAGPRQVYFSLGARLI